MGRLYHAEEFDRPNKGCGARVIVGLDSLENVKDLLSLLSGDVANPLE